MMGTQKFWDGTLTFDDFCVAAKALCKRWQEMDSTLPHWTWIPTKRGEGYLTLENVYYRSLNKVPIGEVGFSEEDEPVDSATLAQCSSEETHIYNFQIVYSFSYRVPVLYFHGHQCDGQPLSLCEIQKDLPNYSLSLLKESKWTFMTQEEHPYLRRPSYMLHPCGTSDWMKLLLGDNQQKELVVIWYLSSWLSVVSQAVGLRIPLNLHTETFQSSASFVGNG